MRKFRITVNGNTYEVDVEELNANTVSSQAPGLTSGPISHSAPAPAQAASVQASSGSVGSTLLEAPMQGKIVAVKVEAGGKVQEGDVVAVLEAMKMENEIVAPKSGTLATVDVAAGQSVEAGDLIASLN